MTPAEVRRRLQDAVQDSTVLALHEPLAEHPREFLRQLLFILNATLRRHGITADVGIDTRHGVKGVGSIRIKTSRGPVKLSASWTSRTFECRTLKFSIGEATAKTNAAAFVINEIVRALPPANTIKIEDAMTEKA